MTTDGIGVQAERTMVGIDSGIRAQARIRPEDIAVIAADGCLTYRELVGRANALAHHLVASGVGPGTIVGVAMEKGTEQVVAVLAIHGAGGAYVPLDPALPHERIRELLRQTKARIALVHSRFVSRLPTDVDVEYVAVDTHAALADEAPMVARSPADMAYVIFTSGSTGVPKGVVITHAGAWNTIADVNDRFSVGGHDRVFGVSSLSFDLSVWDIFGVLGAGGTLVLPRPDGGRDPAHWAKLLREERITIWNSVPALFDMLIACADGDAAVVGDSLRLVLLGGDWIPLDLPGRLRSLVPNARMVSTGGATEASIWSVMFPIDEVDPSWPSIPYGTALSGQSVYVLDAEFRPLPPGEAGEIFLAGRGLAVGYLGQPDLTAAAFLRNPLTGERLYRTGDRGRLLRDGNVEFLGRVDGQVKIGGFRIELGEIEAVLQKHDAVRSAAVVVAGDERRGRSLAAFVSRHEDAQPTEEELRRFLGERLPAYMVPRVVEVVDHLPLTPNGKLDRVQLRRRVAESQTVPSHPVLPGDVDEITLAVTAVWKDLLRKENIGPDDDFFKLGGDSLLATHAAVALRRDHGLHIGLDLIFAHTTLASFAAAVRASTSPESASELAAAIPPRPAGLVDLPLSFGQEQVWFLERLDPDNRAYQFQCVLEIDGPLDVEVLRAALTDVVRRHEILRTTFAESEGEPVQVIHDPFDVDLPVIDLSDEHGVQQRRLDDLRRRLVDVRFDTSRLPLIRWTAIKLSPESFVVVQVEHHFVHDGWSLGVLWREVGELYTARVDGRQPVLPEPVQFADYALFQRSRYTGARREELRAYWRDRLSGAKEVTLPAIRDRPRLQTFRGQMDREVLPADLYDALRTRAREEGTSLFMLMLAAFVALLHRYTRENDIVVGSWFAHRHWPASHSIIGMLVNSVALRVAAEPDLPFTKLLAGVRDCVAEAYRHQEAPFDDVVRVHGERRDLSRNPLTQIFFSFHDSPIDDIEWGGGVTGRIIESSNGSSKFDLNVVVVPRAEQRRSHDVRGSDELAVMWEHNLDLLDAAEVGELASSYRAILAHVARDPVTTIRDLDVFGEREPRRVLEDWNATAAPIREATAAQLFARVALERPNDVALVWGDTSVTYASLAAAAQHVAHRLLDAGVTVGAPVAIHVERSPEFVAAVLGSMWIGAPFVPLDPAYPASRLALMIDDASPAAVATTQDLVSRLPGAGAQTVLLGADMWAEREPAQALTPAAAATAYLIYTSGSTGRPKGVVVRHQALANLLQAFCESPGFSSSDVLLAVTTLSFDIAYLELLLPLVAGGRLVLAPSDVVRDGERLSRLIEDSGATVVQATPTMWRMLIQAGWGGNEQLRCFAGGELLPRDLADAVLDRCGELWNLYGPTETTIWSTAYRVSRGTGDVPIGRPIANTRVYIVEDDLRVAPFGALGELCIAGAGVADGYHNNAELTAERFVIADFGRQTERVYRTGDLARSRPDGTLEFRGRIDRQLKLRGYRIEPEEVERALRRRPGVRDAAVVVEAVDGIEQLVAYVEGEDVALDELRHELGRTLPQYMRPSIVVPLPKLPLTPNGKVDTNAMARAARTPGVVMGAASAVDSKEGSPPADDREEAICRIWADVLRLPSVSRSDDFFELGGHSLLALRLVSRLRDELGVQISVRSVFDHATPADLARALSGTPAAVA